MENENVGEQPEIENNEIQENGSPFGKFADLESLKTGYENLEKEFTRKSQLLKELQNESEKSSLNSGDETERETLKTLPSSEDTLNEVEDEKTEQEEKLPYWEREDWQTQVQDFLEQNPLAKNYAMQISQTVLEDKEILNSKNPLQQAWAKWLEKSFKTPEQLLTDPDFLEKVKKNQDVRRAIIKDYVSELNSLPKAPPVFASSSQSGPSSSNENFPKTLEEAKEWAKKIFSN